MQKMYKKMRKIWRKEKSASMAENYEKSREGQRQGITTTTTEPSRQTFILR